VPFGQLVFGRPGSGKTTYCNGVSQPGPHSTVREGEGKVGVCQEDGMWGRGCVGLRGGQWGGGWGENNIGS